MRHQHVAREGLAWEEGGRRWWTTVDVRRAFRITAEGVRWLARGGRLPYERTRSGQYLFHGEDVRRVLHERAELAVAMIRPRRVRARAGSTPRQLPLFSAQVLRFRPQEDATRSPSEGSRDQAETRAGGDR